MEAQNGRPAVLESQRKKMAEEEQMKKVEVQQRIKLTQTFLSPFIVARAVRKLEEKTQALNELALSAELKAKEHELALRERQVAEAKHLEMAKIEIAKREGRESLSEADLARIKNDGCGPKLWLEQLGIMLPAKIIDRCLSGTITTEMALRAQAERLRRRKLETLDLKARQHNLQVQALRDLPERERAYTEAQLREIRDRDHRLKLKEKGLQEREITDHLRRRQENDREALRRELELLEHQLRRKEILEAELSIKRAMEKENPLPWASLDHLSKRSKPKRNTGHVTPGDGHNFTSLGSRTPNVNPLSRTPSVGHRTPHLHHLSPGPPMMMGLPVHDRLHEEQMRQKEDMHMRQDLLNAATSRVPTPRHREGPSRQTTPQPHRDTLDHNRLSVGGRATPRMRGEEVLGDNLPRTPGRSRSQSFDHRRPSSAAMTARDYEESRGRVREESRNRAREGSRSRHDSQLSMGPEDVMSIARAESRAALREEFGALEREKKGLTRKHSNPNACEMSYGREKNIIE
ncbi:hypothetical protein H4Q26_003152 [Puccinia striiformis f. sp. tritici PST-130]|nr:hypothetical protein H4Q26_003152 [Puccinia striiformis f. sp. tritici PST-130]